MLTTIRFDSRALNKKEKIQHPQTSSDAIGTLGRINETKTNLLRAPRKPPDSNSTGAETREKQGGGAQRALPECALRDGAWGLQSRIT